MLSSLEASGPREFDAVLVDNASTDNSVRLVREKHPWVEVLENPENLGGTGGFNRGMTYGLQHPGNYEYFWLLDNDVYVHPGAYRALLQPMLDNERIGMVGAAILLMSDPSQVQEAGVRIVWSTGAFERNGGGPLANVEQNALLESDFVPACSCLVRVAAIREVGIWDPAFFLMWDDIEWGIRFTRAGWKVVAATDALVRHESYDNRRAKSPSWIGYIWLRNSLYTFRNHAVGANRLSIFFNIFRQTLTLLDNCAAGGRESEHRALRQAISDFFLNRMGKPPQELYSAASVQVSGASEKPAQLRNVALLVTDNADAARQRYSQLKSDYPDAQISCIVTQLRPELLAEDLPNRKLQSVDSLFKRLSFALKLALRYDAAANASNQPQYLYVKLARMLLQFEDEHRYFAVRRDLPATLWLIAKRPFLWLRAAIYAVRASRLKPVPVNYHFWRT